MAGSKPHFRLKALNKVTGQKSNYLGGAWVNPNGSITLVLDMFVTIPSDPSIVLTLFPADFGTDPLSEALATGTPVFERPAPIYKDSAAREAVLQVVCPECDAQAGERCIGVQGQIRKSCHEKRWKTHTKG